MLWKLLLTAAVALAAIHGSAAQLINCWAERDYIIDHCATPLGCPTPQCNEDGTFKTKITKESTGYTYCANLVNGYIFEDSAVSPITPLELPCNTWWIDFPTKCWEVRDTAPAGPGMYVPQCNDDDTFKTKQCWGSTGYCYCANPVNGYIYNETAVGPDEPIELDCNMYWTTHPVLPYCATDIVLVLDVSSSIPQNQFDLARQFMVYFVDCEAFQRLGIQIGLINYTCEAHTYFDLAPITMGMSYEIEQLMRGDGGITCTGRAIYYMRYTSNFRDEAHHTAVILTDGYSEDDQQAAATDARNAGIDLYAVEFGNYVNFYALEAMTTSGSRVFDTSQACDLAQKIVDDQCG